PFPPGSVYRLGLLGPPRELADLLRGCVRVREGVRDRDLGAPLPRRELRELRVRVGLAVLLREQLAELVGLLVRPPRGVALLGQLLDPPLVDHPLPSSDRWCGRNQYLMIEKKSRSPSLSRPFKKVSSMMQAIPTTLAPRRSTSLAVALAVPPVASTSSTT